MRRNLAAAPCIPAFAIAVRRAAWTFAASIPQERYARGRAGAQADLAFEPVEESLLQAPIDDGEAPELRNCCRPAQADALVAAILFNAIQHLWNFDTVERESRGFTVDAKAQARERLVQGKFVPPL